MEIALIRHARPERWEGSGPADPSLNETGRAQAQVLVNHLSQNGSPSFAGVYSSTMARAVETARPIADQYGLALHTDGDLVEYDHGMNFYIPTEEIEGDFEKYWADLQAGWYGGQSIDLPHFQSRVVAGIDRIIAAHADDDLVAVVCHGGVISAYLSSVVGNSHPLFFEPDYTSINRVGISANGRRYLLSANETPHMGFAAWETPTKPGFPAAT